MTGIKDKYYDMAADFECNTDTCPFGWNSCRRSGVCEQRTEVASLLRNVVGEALKQCEDIFYEHWQNPQTHQPSHEAMKILKDIQALSK